MDWTDEGSCHVVVSDIDEAQKRKYNRYIDATDRIWLVADQENAADNIYCSDGKHSTGMEGRVIEFDLVDGSTVDIQGPRHSNSSALFAATGIDVRDKYSTFVVIALDMEYRVSISRPTMIDVQHLDKNWTIGEYERGDKLAQQIANKLNKTVYRYIKSKGGCTSGPIKPTNIQTTTNSK